MTAKEKYKQIINCISILLKKSNWKKKGNKFYLFENKNYGLIEFQKSTHSDAEHISFTINLGVASNLIYKFLGIEYTDNKLPSICDCHWDYRLSSFKYGCDKWWEIDGTTDIMLIVSEVTELLINNGLPEIDKMIRDENMRDSLLGGNYFGTVHEGLLKLVILLHQIGPKDRLENAITTFLKDAERKPYLNYAKQIVEQIRAEQRN